MTSGKYVEPNISGNSIQFYFPFQLQSPSVVDRITPDGTIHMNRKANHFTGATVHIRFYVHVSNIVRANQRIGIIGEGDELGSWALTRATPLQQDHQNQDAWQTLLTLPSTKSCLMYLSFILRVGGGGGYRWRLLLLCC